MNYPKDFRKVCKVCLGLTKSKTKKHCDTCKCVLEELDTGNNQGTGYKDSIHWKLYKKV